VATPFDTLGLFEDLKKNLDRLSEGLVDGAQAVLEAGQSLGAQLRELDQALGRPSSPNPVGNPGRPRTVDPEEAVRLYRHGLTNFEIAEMFGVTPLRVSQVLRAAGVSRPRGAPPRISREDVLRLHEQGLSPREIAPQVGASAVRVAQLISQAGLEPHAAPLAPTARDIEAARRREQVLGLHRQGLTAGEIAQRMDVTPVTVYRILGEEGLRPNLTPEAERARERREEAIALRQEGVSGAEIARRLGISEPAVVSILREFRPAPPPSRAREFEERAFALLPQV
jgi:DNA-binding CsgD family transcriptional regulator